MNKEKDEIPTEVQKGGKKKKAKKKDNSFGEKRNEILFVSYPLYDYNF